MSDSSFIEVLKNKSFVSLWSAQTLSQFADKIFLLFMVVLVTKTQFSNSAVSMVTLVSTIPAVIFGSIAGVFVDRWNKKNILIVCNILRAIAIFMIPFSEDLNYLYLITFLVFTCTQFFAPAEAAMIPILIDKKNLLPANSLFMGTMFSSVVFGFALGSPIISKLSEGTTVITIGSIFFFSALLIFFVNSKEKNLTTEHEHTEKNFSKEFKEGYKYVIQNRIILFCVIRQIIVFSAFAALSVLVIGFVNDVLYLKPVYFGYLLSVAGAGMGLGALFSGKFGNKLGKERIIAWGFVISSIALILLALTNYIAWGLGFERVQQQKELYSSLYQLNNNARNTSVIYDLNNILKNETNKTKLELKNTLERLSDNQIDSLSNLLQLQKESILRLQADEKLKKTYLSTLVNRLAKKQLNFIASNNTSIIISKNINEIAENSKNLKTFFKLQNEYIVSSLFLESPIIQDKVLNSILTITEGKPESLNTLREFLNIDEEGFATLNLRSYIETLSTNKLIQLAELLNIELEELSNSDVQELTLSEYLQKVIVQEPSHDTVIKAQAIKEMLPLHKTPIIKTLLKKEASDFEIIFAFSIALLVGFGAAMSAIPLQAMLQEVVEEKMRGKVFGVQNMAISIAMTVPMAVAGFTADLLDQKFFNMKGVPLVMIITSGFIIVGIFIKSKKILVEGEKV